MEFHNVYEDSRRAEAYSKLEFPATYYLAYRDIPEIIVAHIRGKNALDFGCGAGRSSRFLKNLGFTVIGVDISGDMIKKAKEIDPAGDYRLVADESPAGFGIEAYDLVLSAFTFDNIPTMERKVATFEKLKDSLRGDGCILNLVSSPDIYTHEWASFSTRDFPENLVAKCGDTVKIIMTDVEDRRPVEDIIWYDSDYREVYSQAGLEIAAVYRPLAKESEPFMWVTETTIPPWVIYVLKK
jgi:SAM-dependent methyltransferase